MRATTRVTGAAKNTIAKLLADLGTACAEYQDATLVNLPCRRVECDELWAFCYAKQKNVPEEHRGEPSPHRLTCSRDRSARPPGGHHHDAEHHP